MGFWDDLLRGATAPGVMQNGMNIGISGMAEAQRRKEEQALIQRQEEQRAFENMFKQKQFDQGQKNWQTEFDTNKFFKQQQGVDDLSQIMLSGQNALADNALQKQRFEQVELPVSRAQIQNLAEPNNRYAAGADPNVSGGGSGAASNRNFLLELASKQAQAASMDEFGNFDPSKYPQNLSNIMTALERQQNPQQLMGDIFGGQQQQVEPQMAPQVQGQVTDMEIFEKLKPFVAQGQQVDWDSIARDHPNVNIVGLKAALGVR